MQPGEYLLEAADIEANVGRRIATVWVEHTGDRPVQIGSHYHFYEINDALQFNRQEAYGMHLNIAAGTAVRFNVKEAKNVELVDFGGARKMYGHQGLVNGPLP